MNPAGGESGLELDDAELYADAPCGYLSTRPDGLLIRVNDTFLGWTGYRRDELVGVRRFVDLLSVGGRLYHETHFMPSLQMQSAVREMAFEIVCADRKRISVLVNSTLKRDAAGQPSAVRTAIFLATERREYERELLRAMQRAEESEAKANLMARTLQATLVPPAPPTIPGLDVGAVYRPAGSGEEVGGDFYDVFQVAVDDWAIVVGDVCGKGVEAAVVTALARYTCRAASVEHGRPDGVFQIVNEVLLYDGDKRHCTAALMRARRVDGAWHGTISLAGHPAALLRRAGATELAEFGTYGSLLGIFPLPRFTAESRRLESGDVLLLYTDGVTEARQGDSYFGEERLHRLLVEVEGGAQEIADLVVDAVLDFQDGNPRDDIAVVVIQVP
ncbi:MAG: SpoIIE family protein phosphatase [Ilumatobacteraceae bacterium]